MGFLSLNGASVSYASMMELFSIGLCSHSLGGRNPAEEVSSSNNPAARGEGYTPTPSQACVATHIHTALPPVLLGDDCQHHTDGAPCAPGAPQPAICCSPALPLMDEEINATERK